MDSFGSAHGRCAGVGHDDGGLVLVREVHPVRFIKLCAACDVPTVRTFNADYCSPECAMVGDLHLDLLAYDFTGRLP